MTTKIKKMSFLSMIIFIVGTTIGAGIFFKNKNILSFSQGSLPISIATWGIAIVGMIALAIAIAELVKSQKTDRGTLEWTKIFTPKWFHNSSVSYIKYIYYPISLFTMPIYVVNAFEDAGLSLKSSVYVILMAFGIFVWFMITNLISFRFSEISQWVFTTIQLIPLIIFPIIALTKAGEVPILTKEVQVVGSIKGLSGLSPWITLISGISAIAFAFDGFYNVSSLKEEVGCPRKMGKGIICGVMFISTIYLFLTIAFFIGSSNGTGSGIPGIDYRIIKTLNCFVAVGVLSTLNGYVMSAPRQLKGLLQNGEAKGIAWLQKLIYKTRYSEEDKKQHLMAAWSYIALVTILLFFTLGPIGALVYNRDDLGAERLYGTGAYIYSFSDMLVNFISLIMFIIITTSVLGCLIKRRKCGMKKIGLFEVAAFLAIVIFYGAGAYTIIAAIVDMFGVNGLTQEMIVGSIIKFTIFIVIISASLLTGFISARKEEKLSNSIS